MREKSRGLDLISSLRGMGGLRIVAPVDPAFCHYWKPHLKQFNIVQERGTGIQLKW